MKNSTWCQMSRRGSCWGWKSRSRWTCLHQLLSSEATISPPLFSEFGKHPAKMKMFWECECSKLVKFLKPFGNIKKTFCLLQILLNLQVWSTKPALEWTPHCKISPLPAHCIIQYNVYMYLQWRFFTKQKPRQNSLLHFLDFPHWPSKEQTPESLMIMGWDSGIERQICTKWSEYLSNVLLPHFLHHLNQCALI